MRCTGSSREPSGEFKKALISVLEQEWPEAREDPERHVTVLLQLLR